MLKQITKRGYKLFFISALLIVTRIFQEINNRNIAFNKDNELKIEQSKRDLNITTGINKGVDDATKRIFTGLSTAFAKQGFQYDTIKNEVSKLKDSVKTIPIGKYPLFIFRDIKLKDSTHGVYSKYIEITLESVGVSSYNINLKADLYTRNFAKEYKKLGSNINIIGTNSYLAETQSQSYDLYVLYNNSIECYIFHLFGSYKKSNGKTIKTDSFYSVDVKNSTFGQPLDDMTEKLKKIY